MAFSFNPSYDMFIALKSLATSATPTRTKYLLGRRCEMSPNRSQNIVFRCDTDNLVDDLSALKNQHCWQGGHVVPGRHLRIGIDIQFSDEKAIAGTGGDFIQDRCHPMARATPIGPEVNEHQVIAVEDH